MGRWQIIRRCPKVICDTGHNEAGIKYVVEQLRKESYNQLHIVIGMVNDKDITKVLSLLPKDAIYYFTQAAIDRALKSEDLKEKAAVYNLIGDSYVSVKESIVSSLSAAKESDLIFIGGSNFIVGEALPYFNIIHK